SAGPPGPSRGRRRVRAGAGVPAPPGARRGRGTRPPQIRDGQTVSTTVVTVSWTGVDDRTGPGCACGPPAVPPDTRHEPHFFRENPFAEPSRDGHNERTHLKTSRGRNLMHSLSSGGDGFMATTIDDRTTDIPVEEAIEPKFEYPGIPTTCDGAEAIVWVETRISQGSGAFPITSSTTMGGGFNQAVANGVPNLWGDQLVFLEPESEHSAATFCEGFAL